MRKLLALTLTTALVLSSVWLLACGGGGEKQAGEEPESQETMLAEKEQGDTGGEVKDAGWKDIPIYSGAERFENEMTERMSAAMSARSEGGSSKVQFYKSSDDFDKIVKYYKSHMSRKGWKLVTDQEEEEGWGSMWQKGDDILVNVSVIRDAEGERGIIIARHEGLNK
jgi:hypothetical protein